MLPPLQHDPFMQLLHVKELGQGDAVVAEVCLQAAGAICFTPPRKGDGEMFRRTPAGPGQQAPRGIPEEPPYAAAG